jgi:arylsulfatase A-like enzyme
MVSLARHRAPHQPFTNDPDFVYKNSEIKAPPGWPKNQEIKPISWPKYYATVSMLDREIGRVLKKLDDLHLADKTFVFFASDNGFMFGSHGYHGKELWYEESIRVPALARWPAKIKPGTNVRALLSSVDFFPTILDLAHLKSQAGVEGVSMLPALVNDRLVRPAVFSELLPGDEDFWQMVRTDRWKYVEFEQGKKKKGIPNQQLLYDLITDPSELTDLSNSPNHKDTINNMKEMLNSWRKATDSGPKKPKKPKR